LPQDVGGSSAKRLFDAERGLPVRLVPALSLLIAACGQGAPEAQSVEKAWVRLPAVEGRPGAAYFTLKGGATDDRLMSVSSPQAVRAEMHDMTMEGGAMKMAAIEGGVELKAGGSLAFAPGGKHVMLYDIAPALSAGKKLPLTFTFASGATLEAQADTVAAGDAEPHAH
jgi:periplasmic copper chaperone A